MDRIEKHLGESLKILARSSIIVLITLFLSKVINYAYRVVIARFYGPEVYGLVSLALVFFSLFAVMCSYGLIDGMLRYISIFRSKKEIHKVRYIIFLSFKISLITSVISGLLLFSSAKFISVDLLHNSDLTIYLRYFSLLIPLFVFSSAFLAILRAYEYIFLNSIIQNIIQNLSKLVFLIIFSVFGWKTFSLIGSQSFGIILMLAFSYLFFRIKVSKSLVKKNISINQKNEIVTNLISYSFPMLLLGIIGSLLYWIDSFIIGYFSSVQEVGFYNAAVPIAMLFSIAPEIFLQLFFPLITKEFAQGKVDLIKELSKQVVKWIFIINLPIFLIILIFPGTIINVLFGQEFLVAENALRILSIGSFFYSISVVSNTLLLMKGRSKTILINTSIFVLFNIVFGLILVPVYGINGAAVSTTLCNIFSGILFIISSNKAVGIIPFRRKMIRITIISCIPLSITLILRQFFEINLFSLIIMGLIFLTVYILLLFITKSLDRNDLLIIKTIGDKRIKSISLSKKETPLN